MPNPANAIMEMWRHVVPLRTKTGLQYGDIISRRPCGSSCYPLFDSLPRQDDKERAPAAREHTAVAPSHRSLCVTSVAGPASVFHASRYLLLSKEERSVRGGERDVGGVAIFSRLMRGWAATFSHPYKSTAEKHSHLHARGRTLKSTTFSRSALIIYLKRGFPTIIRKPATTVATQYNNSIYDIPTLLIISI